MQTAAAQRLLSMMMSTNHHMRAGGGYHSPIMRYEAQKRKIGTTRRRIMSNTTIDEEYDALRTSCRKRRRSAIQTGRELSAMKLRKRRMKNRDPKRFWMPGVSYPWSR